MEKEEEEGDKVDEEIIRGRKVEGGGMEKRKESRERR